VVFWTSAIRAAHASTFARFVVVGVINTAVGYAVYLLLIHWIGYELAYAAAYVFGVVVAYLLNSIFVFRAPLGLRTALGYPLVYVAQYLFGALLLQVLVTWLELDPRPAALVALILSVPVSFVLNRIALVRRGARP
jgi:putative flippase GtrA